MKNLVLDCDESSFRLADGRTIKNLAELNESLENMNDDVFNHHVNNERNDFSNWVKEVINDEELATRLLAARDKNTAQIIVLKRIIQIINQMTK